MPKSLDVPVLALEFKRTEVGQACIFLCHHRFERFELFRQLARLVNPRHVK